MAYSRKKELLDKIVSIKSFEKNPIKGGTPAIENRIIVIVVRWKLLKENLLNECRVLKFVRTTVKRTQNNEIKEVLYKNM